MHYLNTAFVPHFLPIFLVLSLPLCQCSMLSCTSECACSSAGLLICSFYFFAFVIFPQIFCPVLCAVFLILSQDLSFFFSSFNGPYFMLLLRFAPCIYFIVSAFTVMSLWFLFSFLLHLLKPFNPTPAPPFISHSVTVSLSFTLSLSHSLSPSLSPAAHGIVLHV